MVRFVMRPSPHAVAGQTDRDPDNSDIRLGWPAPASDPLFNGKATDFLSAYLHLSRFHEQIKAGDVAIDRRVVHMIGSFILGQVYEDQKQRFFLYREAAETLADCMALANTEGVARVACELLTQALSATSGDAHRAAAGALGTLPLTIKGPGAAAGPAGSTPIVRWGALLQRAGLEKDAVPDVVGRSLVVPYPRGDQILVLKMARMEDTPGDLRRESDWMGFLRGLEQAFARRFDIPEPLEVANAKVFRLMDTPPAFLPAARLHPGKYAIGFTTTRAYYAYPNESCPEKRLGAEQFQEVMRRNAWILGRLAAMGIFHDALIPLFHNRTQRGRRDDQGAYEWVRAGRLDRWLHSCEHPNIGVSGVRDFEHLLPLDGKNSGPYRAMGKHFISMLLVTGSYFRKKDPGLQGLDAGGRPVDARRLFDEGGLINIIHGIFDNYYEGFTGVRFVERLPFDLHALARRMIEEMGVDRHMEERVRVADQQAMNDREFRSFLSDRGCGDTAATSLRRGLRDIVIHSGPHLGAFNAGISLPELIESAASMAAACVAGKYWQEKYEDTER